MSQKVYFQSLLIPVCEKYSNIFRVHIPSSRYRQDSAVASCSFRLIIEIILISHFICITVLSVTNIQSVWDKTSFTDCLNMGDDNIFNYRNIDSFYLEDRPVELIVLFTLKYIYTFSNTRFQIFNLSILPLHFAELLQISGIGVGTPDARKQMHVINC